MKTAREYFQLLALLALGTLLTGCAAAHVAHPLPVALEGNAPETQLEFWHSLAEQHVTSNDEAFHGLLLFLDGTDNAKDYAGRVAILKSRGMLPVEFNERPNDAIERGTMAVAMVRILGIKGGWAMHVIGPTPRYAVKQLIYMGLLPDSSPNQTFSGSEFLGVIGKLEDTQSTAAAK